MTQPLLAIDGLARHFGALSALNGVSLSVAPRERRAIIGPNGAGKTTLFNVITGQLAPSAGTVFFDGAPVAGLPPHALARRGMGRSFQRTNLFPRLTVLENLRLAAAAGGHGSYDLIGSIERLRVPLARAREAAAAVGLAGRLGEHAGRLSYGEQRQLEVGVVLATGPKLMLLDEPTAGMSPGSSRTWIWIPRARASSRHWLRVISSAFWASWFRLTGTVGTTGRASVNPIRR